MEHDLKRLANRDKHGATRANEAASNFSYRTKVRRFARGVILELSMEISIEIIPFSQLKSRYVARSSSWKMFEERMFASFSFPFEGEQKT